MGARAGIYYAYIIIRLGTITSVLLELRNAPGYYWGMRTTEKISKELHDKLVNGVVSHDELRNEYPGLTDETIFSVAGDCCAGSGQHSHSVPTRHGEQVHMRDGAHEGTLISWAASSASYIFQGLDTCAETLSAPRCVLVRGQDPSDLPYPHGLDLDSPDGLSLVGVELNDELDWLTRGAVVLWDSEGPLKPLKGRKLRMAVADRPRLSKRNRPL